MTDARLKSQSLKSWRNPLISLAVICIIGLIFDFLDNAFFQHMVIYVLFNMLLSMGLNLVNGYTGQFSLGHAGFMAVGAYFSAWLSTQFQIFPEALGFLNFFIYAICGGALAALAGYMVGLPSLRLRGDYLAIVTLGFAEIIRVILLNMDQLGGARGMYGIPGYASISLFGDVSISPFMNGFLQGAIWVLICFFVIWRLIKSSHGRSFISVREDEIAAQAMGIDTTKTKVRAFVISSFFAGTAGSLFAHFTHYLNPSTFSFVMSVNVIIMVVLGGMGSMTGSLISAAFITILPELLRPLQEVTGVDLRMVIFSATLIVLMIVRPQGLFGNMEFGDLWRKYVKSRS
ncbi:MAG: branched-chain amino acid ABC transporter permease [Pseudobdellovibrionaceae bacterium]